MVYALSLVLHHFLKISAAVPTNVHFREKSYTIVTLKADDRHEEVQTKNNRLIKQREPGSEGQVL